MITLGAAFKQSVAFLRENDIDNAENECRFLYEKAFNISSADFIVAKDREISSIQYETVKKMLLRRISGEPIQYILGEWDFLDSTFKVGEGVLIPRPETEELCLIAIDEAKKCRLPVVYDLCSGSGCIGISIKKAIPYSDVTLVEKSDDALRYLAANAAEICGENSPQIIHGDILNFGLFTDIPDADIIVSNPPYIRSDELPLLQKEVQNEPSMALDGGADGLVFYRGLCDFWIGKLKNGGVMLLECGENQAQEISQLFCSAGYHTEIRKDFADIERMVVIRR